MCVLPTGSMSMGDMQGWVDKNSHLWAGRREAEGGSNVQGQWGVGRQLWHLPWKACSPESYRVPSKGTRACGSQNPLVQGTGQGTLQRMEGHMGK